MQPVTIAPGSLHTALHDSRVSKLLALPPHPPYTKESQAPPDVSKKNRGRRLRHGPCCAGNTQLSGCDVALTVPLGRSVSRPGHGHAPLQRMAVPGLRHAARQLLGAVSLVARQTGTCASGHPQVGPKGGGGGAGDGSGAAAGAALGGCAGKGVPATGWLAAGCWAAGVGLGACGFLGSAGGLRGTAEPDHCFVCAFCVDR